MDIRNILGKIDQIYTESVTEDADQLKEIMNLSESEHDDDDDDDDGTDGKFRDEWGRDTEEQDQWKKNVTGKKNKQGMSESQEDDDDESVGYDDEDDNDWEAGIDWDEEEEVDDDDEVDESMISETKKPSLKDIFHKLSEDATAGMKPFAVVAPGSNKPEGAAVLKSPNPTIQNMLKGLNPRDLQVVMTGQPAQSGQTAQPTTTQPATTGATTVREEQLDEKAPPGMEDVVLSLKKKFPGEEGRAYAIAWSMYNKKHGKNESMAESEPKKKAVVQTDKPIGYKISDIGPNGKEYNVKTDKVWNEKHKKTEKVTNEVEQPTIDNMTAMGAGLGAGRNPKVLETSKKVNESMNKKLKAAWHEGRAHGLKGHSHNGKHYEDMEEARQYHEGYKCGLDECYGMGVYEEAPAATVPGMASQAMPAMEADMDEGNAFTAALAKTPKGGKFTVGGKTFTDTSNLDEYAFESLDRQLNALLNEDTVTEGMSVALTQGLQGIDDSVNVSATDADADKLLAFVKQAALGNLGDAQSSDYGAPVDQQGNASVDEHDSIMALIKKMSGGGDYEQEATPSDSGCGSCGKAPCECEMMHETETEDQMEYEVAEDNAPDSDEAETAADEDAEAEEDKALAMKSMNEGGDGGEASEEPEMTEEELTEWANDAREIGTDEAFQADIDFMTKIISGGLNKQKRDQTTLPHTAVKVVSDPINEWKKLSGIIK